MIVPIQNLNGTKEWGIIELHGELINEDEGNCSDNKFVGEMYYLKCGTPVLIIGNHVLQGKEMKLEKPIAVLEKKEFVNLDNNVGYNLRAIVKKKLIFRTRPKNLMADSQ